MVGIAIHGFGRIGRSTLRAALTNGLFVPAAISDIKDLSALAALFAVDTNYGRWPRSVAAEGGSSTSASRLSRTSTAVASCPTGRRWVWRW
jgi:glyceraldehyde 3-phosphate dehydrogenase